MLEGISKDAMSFSPLMRMEDEVATLGPMRLEVCRNAGTREPGSSSSVLRRSRP